MTIDKADAALALGDIDQVIERLKQSQIYRTTSTMLIMWGAIVTGGYVLEWLTPRYSGLTWLLCQLGGLAMTLAISMRQPRRYDLRIAGAMTLFIGFGLLWCIVFGKFGPRELDAFWATFFMLGYTIAGLWFGRAFIAIGLTITALTVAGYLWAGPWFTPYMAVVNGGGLILCGLCMRRA